MMKINICVSGNAEETFTYRLDGKLYTVRAISVLQAMDRIVYQVGAKHLDEGMSAGAKKTKGKALVGHLSARDLHLDCPDASKASLATLYAQIYKLTKDGMAVPSSKADRLTRLNGIRMQLDSQT